MDEIQFGNALERKKKEAEKSLEDKYSEYDPKVSDIAWYFYNIFLEKEGKEKYAPLIGEQANGIAAFMAFVMGDAPVIIKSWAGTGKTILSNAIESLIPDDFIHEVDMGSNMGVWYQAKEINASKFVFFPEFQNSTDNKEVEKILKKWGEGENAKRSRADVTRSNADEDATIDRVLECRPFFTTLAVENKSGAGIWNDEFGRRMIDLYTDVSEDQTKRVVEYMLQVYEHGVESMANMTAADKEMLQHHIVRAVEAKETLVKQYRFPAASRMLNQIPTKFVQARSALPLLMKMMNSFAVYNYKNRIVTEDGVMLVTPEDLYYAWVCYGKRFAQKCFNMEMLADELLQIFPTPKNPMMPARQEQFNEKQIKTELKKHKINISKQKLTKLLESFVDTGIIEEERDPEMDGEVLYYRTGIDDFEENFDFREIINYCREQVTKDYPKYAAAYIKRYCENPIIEHPFEPFKINLNTREKYDIERPWDV